MTDKELRKLSRVELLEMLLEQSEENERQRQQIEQLTEQLRDKQLEITDAGSIAEAALRVNGVYEAAQRAADQYLENIRQLTEKTEKKCQLMEEETRRRCAEMIRKAKQGTLQ